MTEAYEQDRTTALLNKEGKYLTFALAHEEYGLGILKVREIIGYIDVTAVPQTPHYVKGVINLRGQVIPVIDLRANADPPARIRCTNVPCGTISNSTSPLLNCTSKGEVGGRLPRAGRHEMAFLTW